jgi:hypothetical protein
MSARLSRMAQTKPGIARKTTFNIFQSSGKDCGGEENFLPRLVDLGRKGRRQNQGSLRIDIFFK